MYELEEAKIKAKLANLSPDKLADAEATCMLTFQEHFVFQDLKSRAHASGKLALDIAMWLYETLGNSHDSFNKQPLERRVIVIAAMREIVDRMK